MLCDYTIQGAYAGAQKSIFQGLAVKFVFRQSVNFKRTDFVGS